MTYQAVNSGKPGHMRGLLQDFDLDTVLSLRYSRDQHRHYEPRVNLELGFRAFEKCAQHLYNNLPMDVMKSENVQTFKKALKAHLFTRSYNAINMCFEYYYRC